MAMVSRSGGFLATKFLTVIAAMLVLAACNDASKSEVAAAAPNLILHNGRVYTANSDQAVAQALAVRGDTVIAVGDNSAMLALADDATQRIDLGGKLVLPGLHDAHIHPMGVIKYDSCNLESQGMNLLRLSQFVAACLNRIDIPAGSWLSVRQWGFGDNNLPAGGYNSLREALDAAAPDTPVILIGNDGHHNATNSAGLALARNREGERIGLSAATLQSTFSALEPFIGLDAEGEPNGAINEGVYRVLGAPGIIEADAEIIAENAWQLAPRLSSLGITSIQDAAAAPATLPFYESLLKGGPVPLRIRLAQFLVPENYLDENDELDIAAMLDDARIVRDRYAAVPEINANALKWFVDGVLEGDPLADPPTLPNSAVLQPLLQPQFHVDAAAGQVNLVGYVDPESEACEAWRSGEYAGSEGKQRFIREKGHHPGQCQRSSGVMYAPAEVTKAFAVAADEAGFAVHFHAIGDKSVQAAVDAIAAVTRDDVQVNRHSIAHLQLVADADIERLASLRVPLAFTFAWARTAFAYDVTVIPFIEKLASLEDMYNPESYYYNHFYPAESIRSAGGIIAAGSDAPVETDDPRPFENIEAAVTRDRGEGVFNPAERLNILDAIDAYTINGARLLGQEGIVGSLEAGKKADFIILDRDIIAMAAADQAADIHRTQVLKTFFNGQLVYDANE